MIYFYKHDIQICESYRHDMQICESYRYEEQNIAASMISFHQHHKTHNRYKKGRPDSGENIYLIQKPTELDPLPLP